MKTKNELLAEIIVKQFNGQPLTSDETKLLVENAAALTNVVKTTKKVVKDSENSESKAAAAAAHKVEVNKLFGEFVKTLKGKTFENSSEVKTLFQDFIKTLPTLKGENSGSYELKPIKTLKTDDSLSGLIWSAIVNSGENGVSKADIKAVLAAKGYSKNTCDTQAGTVHKKFPVKKLDNGNFVAAEQK